MGGRGSSSSMGAGGAAGIAATQQQPQNAPPFAVPQGIKINAGNIITPAAVIIASTLWRWAITSSRPMSTATTTSLTARRWFTAQATTKQEEARNGIQGTRIHQRGYGRFAGQLERQHQRQKAHCQGQKENHRPEKGSGQKARRQKGQVTKYPPLALDAEMRRVLFYFYR